MATSSKCPETSDSDDLSTTSLSSFESEMMKPRASPLTLMTLPTKIRDQIFQYVVSDTMTNYNRSKDDVVCPSLCYMALRHAAQRFERPIYIAYLLRLIEVYPPDAIDRFREYKRILGLRSMDHPPHPTVVNPLRPFFLVCRQMRNDVLNARWTLYRTDRCVEVSVCTQACANGAHNATTFLSAQGAAQYDLWFLLW